LNCRGVLATAPWHRPRQLAESPRCAAPIDKTALPVPAAAGCYRGAGHGAFGTRRFIAIAAAARAAGRVRESQPIPTVAVSCTIGVTDIV